MPEVEIPSRRRRKEARPQELLQAALALFVSKGFSATRIEEVAQQAGVSKGTLYLYYPSKEDLLKAVIRDCLSARIAAGAEQAAGHTGSAADLLRGTLVDWWTELYDKPAAGVFKLVITEVGNFPELGEFYAREVVEPARLLLKQVIDRGVADGEFQTVDADSAVHSLVFPMVMACLHRHSLAQCPIDWRLDGRHFIAQHVDLVLHGLCRAPTAPRVAPPVAPPAAHTAR